MIPGLLVIVPCGQKKIWDRSPNAGPAPAGNAYTGAPFVVNKEFADCIATEWIILSAKYGFIKPDYPIPGPYNVTFKKRSSGPIDFATLREQVGSLELNRFSKIIGLGGKEYRQAIEAAFEGTRVQLSFPFSGLQIGKMMQATKRAIKDHEPSVTAVVTSQFVRQSASVSTAPPSIVQPNRSRLKEHSSNVGQMCQPLHELFNSLPAFTFPFESSRIPQNGIYVLFENGEEAHGTRRIVRVGTHTGTNQLRSRLKQHFVHEVKDRSIFRKNIGRCFLHRDGDPFLAWWELDLTSRTAREANAHHVDFKKQSEVESRVSKYIQDNFSVAVVELESEDQRLTLESKIISTLFQCSDCGPSSTWLGLQSPKQKILDSGLWQVNELNKTPMSASDLFELQNRAGNGHDPS